MIIKGVDLAGYDFHKVNSDYLFKQGLNFIVGENASGKTTILNSIISGFTAETYQEHWIHPPLESNQEPIIAIEFQYQEETYCITKKIKKDGIECQLYAINERKERSLVCEGAEAIERIKQYSNEIIYLRGEEIQSMHHQLGILNPDEQSLPEFQMLLNELLLTYDAFGYWGDKQVAIVEGQFLVRGLDGSISGILAAGGISYLVFMSIITSIKMNKNCPILILDDWDGGMTNYQLDILSRCLTELDSQVILSSHSMHRPNLEVEANMIHLNR